MALLSLLAAVLPPCFFVAASGAEVTTASFVAAGRQFSFVVDNGVARAMGRNGYGQLGINSTEDQIVPVPVEFPVNDSEVRDIAAGAFHTVFLMASGSVYSAGQNRFGQLAGGLNSSTEGLVKVVLGDDAAVSVVAVAAGYAHSLFLLDDGTVQAAGLNAAGQLGDGSTLPRSTPGLVALNATERIVQIVAGYDFSYFVTEGGDLWATGQNLGGQLGDGTGETQLSPVRVMGGVQAVAAGQSHGLFLMRDGRVLATGSNFDGQLGSGLASAPKLAPEGHAVDCADCASVAASGDSSCLVSGAALDVQCFGSNRLGQIGFGGEDNMLEPAFVPKVPGGVGSVAMGFSHSLFVAGTGDVFVTGSNRFGELGDGTTEDKSTPFELTEVALPTRTTTSVTKTSTTTTTPTVTTLTETILTSTTTTTTTTTVTRDISATPEPGPFDPSGYILGAVALMGVGFTVFLCLVACRNTEKSRQHRADSLRNEADLELVRDQMAHALSGS